MDKAQILYKLLKQQKRAQKDNYRKVYRSSFLCPAEEAIVRLLRGEYLEDIESELQELKAYLIKSGALKTQTIVVPQRSLSIALPSPDTSKVFYKWNEKEAEERGTRAYSILQTDIDFLKLLYRELKKALKVLNKYNDWKERVRVHLTYNKVEEQ